MHVYDYARKHNYKAHTVYTVPEGRNGYAHLFGSKQNSEHTCVLWQIEVQTKSSTHCFCLHAPARTLKERFKVSMASDETCLLEP